jgi:hypothetical protein
MKKSKIYLVILIILIGASFSFALPRFSAKAEQKCNLCHVSPAGGGMRNGFGSQFFALTELAAHETPFEEISRFQPEISEILSVGMDMRNQYIYDEGTDLSTLFQMEGNFYLNAQLDQRFSLTLNKGLYEGFEIYGMGYVFPMNGYFRVGKFQPAYGWRFDDHTSFVREKMLWPAGSRDTGIEFGIQPQYLSAIVGFYNGNQGLFDDGKGKALSSRLELRKNINGLGFGLGGSFYLNDTNAGDQILYGPLYYLNFIEGRLIFLGETDWLDDETIGTGKITSFATTNKLSYMLRRGLWLEGTYDFYDSDIDLLTGSLSRYGLGLNYFPYGFLEVSPYIRYFDPSANDQDGYMMVNGMFHIFF